MAPWTLSRQPKTFILFLDTGDICRCPMAKGVLSHLLNEAGLTHVEIMTAGVMTTASILPTQETRLLLTEAGIDIGRYRSTQYTEQMIRKADLVLGMSPFHVQKAKRLIPEARDKTHLLKEYTRIDMKNVQIPDPMGATLEVYRKVFRDISDSCKRLLEMDIIRKPKPTEGEDIATRRTKPGLSLTTTGKRKVAAPVATKALMSVLAKENRTRKQAESIGFPVTETDVEVTMTDDEPEEMTAAQKRETKKAPAPAAPVKKKPKRVSGAARPVKRPPVEAAPPKKTTKKKSAAKSAKAESATESKPKATKASAKKSTTKAAASKTPAAKKPAAKKPAAKKTTEKKAPAKKATTKAAAKPAAKKPAAKKATTAKKPAAKKPAAAKKAAPKKAAAKKPAAKKAPAKKSSKK